MYPCVENSKGEVVDSGLFKGLLSLFPGNREEAWRHYDIATDAGFLNANDGKLTFDENGEVSLQSYIEAIGMHEPNFPMEKALNAELHKGAYSFQEAIEKVSAFNRKQQKDSKYIATLRPGKKKGQYEIFVAQNTEAEKAAIKKVIKDQNIQDRIIAHLAEHGVGVSFIDGDSRYSTENAERNANGLWQLIEFSKTGKVSHYAEEAGHFIMGAMGNNPLATRLESLLQDEKTRNAMLGEEGITDDLGSNPAREAAGRIIGKALQAELSNNVLQKLTSRLLTSAKKIFGKLSRNTVLQAIAEAEQTAQSFVEEFVTDGIPEGEKEARKRVETLYHKAEAEYVTAARETFQALEDLRRAFKNIKPIRKKKKGENTIELDDNTTVADLIGEIIQIAGDILANPKNTLTDEEAIATMAMRLKEIIDRVIGPEYANLIVDPANIDANSPITADLPPLEAATRLQEEAKRCMAYTLLSRHLEDIGIFIDNMITRRSADEKLIIQGAVTKGAKADEFSTFLSQLRDHKQLHKISAAAQKAYNEKSSNIAASFLQHIYGARFVEYNKGMLWNLSRGKTATIYKLGSIPGVNLGKNTVDVTEIVEEDDWLVKHYLGSLSNSKDIGAQLIVKAIKEAKDTARQEMGKAYSKLIALQKRANKLGISTRKFYTKTDEGEYTGDLIYLYEEDGTNYEIDWYHYRQDRETLLNKAYEAFATATNDEGILLVKQYENSPDAVRSIVFENFLKTSKNPAVKAWRDFNEESKQTIPGTDKFIPKDPKYRKITTLNDAEISWLKDHKTLFDEFKSWLGDKNTMEEGLAPQVRGSKWNTSRNLLNIPLGKGLRAIGTSLWNTVSEFFTNDTELVNTAAHYNWNCEDVHEPNNKIVRDFLRKQDGIEHTPSKMLPVYHHRRLKDTHRLDTDLIAATIQFAAMAANYKAMDSIIDPLEVTKDKLMSRRHEKPWKMWQFLWKGKTPYVNQGIEEYIDSQVYGINYGVIDHLLRGHGKFLTSTAHLAGRAMTLWYLGWNAVSAGVNACVGYLEIFRHACNNQDFTLTDLATATFEYMGRGIPAIVESWLGKDWTKMSLFARETNALDNAEEFYRNYRTNGFERFANWFSPTSLLMKPYALSEHMMQIVPYMAMAKKVQLYADTGGTLKKMSLWQAIEVANQYYDIGKGAKNIRLKHTMFKSKGDFLKYREIMTFSEALKRAWKTHQESKSLLPFNWSEFIDNHPDEAREALIILQKEELINEDKLKQYSPSRALKILEEKLKALTFNDTDMHAFSQKARLITNNMHGVYNQADKTMVHRSFLGMLLLPFKGYAFGMINKRWGSAHYNVLLDREFEGFHAATLKSAAHLGKDVVESIYKFSKSLIVDKELRDQLQTEALDALGHIVHTGLSWAAPVTNRFAPEWTQKQIEKSGNVAQSYAIGKSARAAAIIIGMYFFSQLAKAMAMGAEDDEYIAMLGTAEDLEYQEAWAKAREEDPNLQEKDFMPAYILSKYPQFEVWSGKKKSYNPEFPQIDVSKEILNNIWKKIKKDYDKSSSQTKLKIYNDEICKHIKNEIKRLKRIDAEKNRPGWNMTAIISNRMYRESAAFDTFTGLTSEGKSLIDLYPLPLKAVQDIYHTISITKIGKEFQTQQIDFYDGYREYDTEIIAHYYEVLGGEENKKIAEHLRKSHDVTIEHLADIINIPPHVWRNNLPDMKGRGKRKKFSHSDMYTAISRYKKYIKNAWQANYPDKEMDEYIYSKSKKGKYQKYDPIGATIWRYKLNPIDRLVYESKHGEQVVRDYNFGMASKDK